MSVIVKGIRMPEDCRECPFEMFYHNCGETRCRATNAILATDYKAIPFEGRHEKCPMMQISREEASSDLIFRKAAMESLTKEYNRRFLAGDRDGLKLAWIEKAVNDVEVPGI